MKSTVSTAFTTVQVWCVTISYNFILLLHFTVFDEHWIRCEQGECSLYSNRIVGCLIQGSVPNRARDFPLLVTVRVHCVAHMASSSVGTATKQPGPEADLLHSFSSGVKNVLSCTFIFPGHFYGSHTDGFICIKLGEFRLADLKRLWIT